MQKKDLNSELLSLKNDMKELEERTQLLEQVLQNKDTISFTTILDIKTIKKIEESYYDLDSGETDIIQKRFFYEVKTDTSIFLVMIDFEKEEQYFLYTYFAFYDQLYRFYGPTLSEENTKQLLELILNKEDLQEEHNHTFVQILHPYYEHYKQTEIPEELKKELKESQKEASKNELNLLNSTFEELFN